MTKRDGLGLAWIKLFVRRNLVLLFFFLLLAVGFLFYLYMNRRPFTNNGFLVANVRPVSAFVPGYVTEINVSNNQRVRKGDEMFQIYKAPYELEVKRLEDELTAMNARLVKSKSDIVKNEQLEAKAKAAVDNAKYLSEQATTLADKHAVAEKDAEQRQEQLSEAKSGLNAAQAELDESKAASDEIAAQIKSLENQLANAKINLAETTIIAREDGIVTNLFVGMGTYLKTGDPICAFVETDEWWVQANFKETDLSRVKVGDAAEIRLWIYPDKVFHGEIESVLWNVNRQRSAQGNYLQEVEKENEWFLLPQRLPVTIKIADPDPENHPFHVGASASVVIDAENPVVSEIFWLMRNN